jgi:thiol-disulfide isomerase/thioredoxin
MINESRIEQGMTYAEYRTLLNALLNINQTTGKNHSPEMLKHAKMNIQRMNRLDKTVVLNENLVQSTAALKQKQKWVVLTEGWCGDAAQILPILNKIAESTDKIELVCLLRDENLDIMDLYLTNGGRAIPKLIIFDENLNELANWGPRPKEAHELYWGMKNAGHGYEAISTELHGWYARNKRQV